MSQQIRPREKILYFMSPFQPYPQSHIKSILTSIITVMNILSWSFQRKQKCQWKTTLFNMDKHGFLNLFYHILKCFQHIAHAHFLGIIKPTFSFKPCSIKQLLLCYTLLSFVVYSTIAHFLQKKHSIQEQPLLWKLTLTKI